MGEVHLKRVLKPLFSWRSQIAESELAPTTRLVALTLSLHMSERGDSCYPSLILQAKETGLAKSTVVKALKELEAEGFLERAVKNEGKGGRGQVTGYKATMPPAQPFAETTLEGSVAAAQPSAETTVRQENSSSDAAETVRWTPTKGPPIGPEDVSTEDVQEDVETSEPSALALPEIHVRAIHHEAAAYLKQRLRERGTTVFARDWHLKAAAVARDILQRSGVPPEDLRACIDWALADRFWAGRITTMEKIRDLMPQFQQHRGKPGKAPEPGRATAELAAELARRGL